MYNIGDKILIGVVGVISFAIMIVIVAFIYRIYELDKKPTFSLYKSEWSCIESTTRTTTSNVLIEKVYVPQIQTHDICLTYKRIK